MGGGAWWATVHGVAKSRTRLSDFTSLHFRFFRLSCLTPSASVRQPGHTEQTQLLHEPAGLSMKILEYQSSNGCPNVSLSLADTENARLFQGVPSRC